MKAIVFLTLTFSTFIATAQLVSGKRLASLQEERSFLALQDTIVYAPVDLPFEDRQTVLLSGVRNRGGDCDMPLNESTDDPEAWRSGFSKVTVEIAYNPSLCQSLTYEGWLAEEAHPFKKKR